MEMAVQTFRFSDIDRAPATSGIYAWYCRHHLAAYDIELCISRINQASDPETRQTIAQEFLNQRIFSHFAESPYSVSISGRLKPRYEGNLPHIPTVSKSLTSRIADDPTRLRALASVLRFAVPYFASPIYIGTARSLRDRLRTHVRLFRKLREQQLTAAQPIASTPSTAEADEDNADHSFAFEAAIRRRFDPSDLWASVLPMELSPDSTYDVENVLNRINFPLCGRN